ncbi:MAG: hypothetical protein AAFY41_02095 [Bacteroidota bacterium]
MLGFLTFFESFGQEKSNQIIDFLEMGLFSHSISLPLEASNGVIGLNRVPGITLGAAKQVWRKRTKLNAYYVISFSAYHQEELHYGLTLSNALQAQYRIFQKVNLEGGLGLGYLHTFEDAPIYQYKEGTYQQVRDWGRPQLTTHALIGISLPVSDKVSVTTHYKFMLQLPFASKGGILFIPHSRFGLGARLKILKK